jgi:hypothetical protein
MACDSLRLVQQHDRDAFPDGERQTAGQAGELPRPLICQELAMAGGACKYVKDVGREHSAIHRRIKLFIMP